MLMAWDCRAGFGIWGGAMTVNDYIRYHCTRRQYEHGRVAHLVPVGTIASAAPLCSGPTVPLEATPGLPLCKSCHQVACQMAGKRMGNRPRSRANQTALF